MICLKKNAFFAKGLHRRCFVHPQDGDKCIKIAVNENPKETKREQSYYRLLAKRKISWNGLPKYYGNVETNLGVGSVFDLIRDHDGNVSITLKRWLEDSAFRKEEVEKVLLAMQSLKQYMLKWRIVTMALKSKNILYQKTSPTEEKLVIVDNIGNSDFIPICYYSSFFATRKINRKWKRFETAFYSHPRLNKFLNQYPQSIQAFRQTSGSGSLFEK